MPDALGCRDCLMRTKVKIPEPSTLLTKPQARTPNKHGFRNYPRFRNYGSETISSDSETTWSGSETAVQQLFSRIQKLFRTDSETVCSDSGNSRDSETTVQKLFRAIQKLFRAIQELFSTDSETTHTSTFNSSLRDISKSPPPPPTHLYSHFDFQLFSQRYF